MCGVFKIPKLDSLDDYSVLGFFLVDWSIVRLDICLR
jgi:hypothetical protein